MSSDDEDEFTFKINEEYAKSYERKKEAEELSKLKEKYGEEEYDSDRLLKIANRKRKYGIRDDEPISPDLLSDSASSSSEEEEDETGELVTPAVDAQIMRTLALIRTKDPKVYNSSETFFSEEALEKAREEWEEKQKKKKMERPVTLKDYQRKVLLEDGGFVNEGRELTHVEEQAMLKEDVKKAFAVFGENDEEEGGDFFTTRKKTQNEIEEEEEDYKKFLLESIADNKAGAQAFKDWQKSRDNPNVDSEEAFLIDYILNRGWIDKDAKRNPSYNEIVGDIDMDDDEKALDAADNFESRYNFRFEEEGGSQLVTYGRQVDGAVRRKDDKRKAQRESRAERKKLEKQQKAEELKRLKNLKKKEIFEKLKQIQEITGNKEIGVDDIDLEGDFDPEAYDKKMSKAFDDEYYDQADNEEPVWEDDINIDDIVSSLNEDKEEDPRKGKNGKKGKKGKKNKKNAEATEEDEGAMEWQLEGNEGANGYQDEAYFADGGGNDEDFIMDADYIPGGEKFSELKPKKGTKVAVSKSEKSGRKDFGDYLDEYYQLDYEDMIGDLPTRFKYAKVKSADFGLTPVEILLADDKDLNELVSLKKLAPFRPIEKQEHDLAVWSKSKKRRLREFRFKLEQEAREKNTIEQLKGGKGWELPSLKKRRAKQQETKMQGQPGGKKKKRKTAEVDGVQEQIEKLDGAEEEKEQSIEGKGSGKDGKHSRVKIPL